MHQVRQRPRPPQPPPPPPPPEPTIPEQPWHSQATMNRVRPFPASLQAFYHLACMHNWKEVFHEQLEAFLACGIRPSTFILGNVADAEYVKQHLPVIGWQANFRWYETPTLHELWKWCKDHQDAAVLYCHSKGVSAPDDQGKTCWRRLMMRETVSKWSNHLPELTAVDALGVNFRRSPKGNNYFEGNFWLARSDWVAHLDDPWEHRANPGSWLGGKRWDRMHAEIWILHKPFHHVESLVCQNADLWRPEFCESLLNPEGKGSEEPPAALPATMPATPTPVSVFNEDGDNVTRDKLAGHNDAPGYASPVIATPMPDDEIRRLIRHPKSTERLPEPLKQEVDSILRDCGCRFRQRIDPLMEQLRPYFLADAQVPA